MLGFIFISFCVLPILYTVRGSFGILASSVSVIRTRACT